MSYNIKRNAWLIKELRKFIQARQNIKLANNSFITSKLGNIAVDVYKVIGGVKYIFDGIEFEIYDTKTENYELISYN